jgi:selenocysteine lyase/cysteine desulfurase
MHAGITSFRLTGHTSTEDNIEVARRLLEEFNIFTVHRAGVAAGACVRVTPALFTADEDVVALRDALVKMT